MQNGTMLASASAERSSSGTSRGSFNTTGRSDAIAAQARSAPMENAREATSARRYHHDPIHVATR